MAAAAPGEVADPTVGRPRRRQVVLTWAVLNADEDRYPAVRGQRRRALLRLGALAFLTTPVAGCGLFDDQPAPEPSPDPLVPLINDALDLAARYEAAIAAHPELAERLTPLAQAHHAHAEELSRVTNTPLPAASTTTPGASTTPEPTGSAKKVLSQLRGAEQKGRKLAADACLAAPAERAALVGSIAAARATHVEVLS